MLVSVNTVLRNAATTIAATISSARDREYDLIERIFIGLQIALQFSFRACSCVVIHKKLAKQYVEGYMDG